MHAHTDTGDLVSLAVPVQSNGGTFVGVVGIDFVVSSLRSVLAKIKTRETGEVFVFHIRTRKVPYVCPSMCSYVCPYHEP